MYITDIFCQANVACPGRFPVTKARERRVSTRFGRPHPSSGRGLGAGRELTVDQQRTEREVAASDAEGWRASAWLVADGIDVEPGARVDARDQVRFAAERDVPDLAVRARPSC